MKPTMSEVKISLHWLNSKLNIVFEDTDPGGLVAKNPPGNAGEAGDAGFIPGWGRSPGRGNSNPLQYCFLENPMDRGAWQATGQGVAKSRT